VLSREALDRIDHLVEVSTRDTGDQFSEHGGLTEPPNVAELRGSEDDGLDRPYVI